MEEEGFRLHLLEGERSPETVAAIRAMAQARRVPPPYNPEMGVISVGVTVRKGVSISDTKLYNMEAKTVNTPKSLYWYWTGK